MRFQSGATWTIWCDLPLDLMGLGIFGLCKNCFLNFPPKILIISVFLVPNSKSEKQYLDIHHTYKNFGLGRKF